jgi:hypothetical protein
MNRRRLSFLVASVAVLVVASLCWLAPLTRTTQAAPAPSGDAAFKGKILLVNTQSMYTFLLEKAQIQKMGEQTFLMGKGAADGKIMGWCKGRTVRLRMEQIVAITEFDDIKDAKKALESGGGGLFGPYGITLPAVEATAPGTAPVPAPPGGEAVPPAK